MTTTADFVELPFGKHRGPLPLVPSDYLAWTLRAAKLSAGLRGAIEAELRSRGVEPPPQPPPRPIRPCRRHPRAGHRCFWVTLSDGRRMIRAECRRCRGYLGFAPCREPYLSQADAEGVTP
jgi:hypothetical protein